MATSPLIRTAHGKVEAQSRADFEALLARLGAAPDPRLILFMHGGLVTVDHGTATALSLEATFAGLKADGWETLYPIWGSGLAETVDENRAALQKSPLFVRTVLRIAAWIERHVSAAPFALASPANPDDIEALMTQLEAVAATRGDTLAAGLPAPDLAIAQTIGALEDSDLQQSSLAGEFADDTEFAARAEAHQSELDQSVRDRIDAVARVRPARQDLVAGLTPPAWVVALAAVRAGYRVLHRLLQHRDHGLGPTIVEEICRALYLDLCGATAWGLMKQEARDHFAESGLATELIARLATIAAQRPVRVLLIGHSAGAVFTSHFAAATRTLPADATIDTILLAPAVRMDEAAPLLGNGTTPGRGFRLFTMHDTLEAANHLDNTPFGKVYRRSLLYLISGVLERRDVAHGSISYADAPLLGLERHLTSVGVYDQAEQRVAAAIATFLAPQPPRDVFSQTAAGAPDGLATTSDQHGGFWSDPATARSMVYIARNGF